jgi:hypothetical protein
VVASDALVNLTKPPLQSCSKNNLLLIPLASTTAIPISVAVFTALFALQNVAGVVVIAVEFEYM